MQDWHLNPISQLENKLDRSIVQYICLSCRRHGITLMLKSSGNISSLYQRDVLLWSLQQMDIPNITVKSGSKQYDTLHLISAVLKSNHVSWTLWSHVLEAKTTTVYVCLIWERVVYVSTDTSGSLCSALVAVQRRISSSDWSHEQTEE